MTREFRIFREERTYLGNLTYDCMSFVQYGGRWVIVYENRCRRVTVVPGFYLRDLPNEDYSVLQKAEVEPVVNGDKTLVSSTLKAHGYLGPFEFWE
jgi:hypothetical protein